MIEKGMTARSPDAGREASGVERILVVDDSAAQRHMMRRMLEAMGYQVTEAASGAEALAMCHDGVAADIIISDWVMPGMTGLELCRELRAIPDRPHGYFILLTSKTDNIDVARGLDVGADDYLAKPVSSGVLAARIRAGERIVRMERELLEKNRIVVETLEEISKLYDALDNDLAEAQSLQQSLLREKHRDFGPAQVSLMLRPSGRVGGDLVGFFPVGDDEVGLFAIDVSGHGVASAILTARLATHFAGATPERNVALSHDGPGRVRFDPPAEVVARLNRSFLEEVRTDQYFTMMLACANLRTGHVRLVQCGHPSAIVQDRDGQTRYVGSGGFPVGLIAGVSWTECEVTLEPGARLFIGSDGLTECPDSTGALLGDDGVAEILRRNVEVRGPALLEAIMWDLSAAGDDADFPDDISGIMFEYAGPVSRIH